MSYSRSFNRFILISLTFLGLSVSPVNAAIMSADDSVFGIGSITTDDVSGLEWLDLTLSVGRNYADVSSQFGVGGDFASWRYATVAEITEFFTNAGGTAPYTFLHSQGVNATWVTLLQDYWGVTNTFGDYNESYALTGDAAGNGRVYSGLNDGIPSNFTDVAVSVWTTWPENVGRPDLASALVRPSAVPVPAAIWLFGTALIGLVGFGKRKPRIAAA